MKSRPKNSIVLLITAAMTLLEMNSAGISKYINFENKTVSIDTIAGEDGHMYISLNGLSYSLQYKEGMPAIPYECLAFDVPLYTNEFNVRIRDAVYTALGKFPFRVVPGQNPFPQAVNGVSNKQSVIDSIYNVDGDITAPVITDESCVNGNKHIVDVSIPLVKYNPVTGELKKLVSCCIDLGFTECSSDDLSFIPVPDLEDAWGQKYETVNGLQSESKILVSPQSVAHDSKPYYYILTPDFLKESLEDIVLLKKQKGYQVVVKTVEEIVADSTYKTVLGITAFDKESHVRNWLRYEYGVKQIGTFQLLIIGDYRTSAPLIKFRDSYPHPDHPEYENYNGSNFVPSDIYFSDMTDKFKFGNISDGRSYGYVGYQSYSPQLPVGRLLAYEPSHVESYTKKLIEYEIDPGYGNREYLGKAFVSRQNDFKNQPSFIGTFSVFEDSVIMTDTEGLVDFKNNRPTGKEVIDGMKDCGMICLKGHGSPAVVACSGRHRAWDDYKSNRYIQALDSLGVEYTGCPNGESGNGLDCINNQGKPSIVIASSCTTTPFDAILEDPSIKELPHNVGGSMTVGGDYGCVAFIGNTRKGLISNDTKMELHLGNQLCSGLRLGEAVFRSTKNVDFRYTQFSRNLIGDPDILVWKGKPKEFQSNMIPVKKASSIVIYGTQLDDAFISVFDGTNARGYEKVTKESTASPYIIDCSRFGFTNNSDFMVAIYKDGFLPQLTLFAQNAVLHDVSKAYILRSLDLKSEDSDACYTIMDNGSLRLRLTEDLLTDNGFKISDGGIVNIQAHGKVTLANDVIENGGKMDVEASEVFLQPGFKCEAGSDFRINVIKK